MIEYPEWLEKPRKMYKGGRFYYGASTKRIQDRKWLYDRLPKGFTLEQIDEIITYVKERYKPQTIWYGLSRKARRQLYVDKSGICMWYKKPVSLGNFTVEHIDPIAVGGGDDDENIGIACFSCNQERAKELSNLINFINSLATYRH